MFCRTNHVVPVTVVWALGAVAIDAAAVLAIRFRGRSWVRRVASPDA
jgi:hypothetical protein